MQQQINFEEAIDVLKSITNRKINSDWRSVYRSFHLLYLIYVELNEEKESNKYKNLCIQSNHKYPISQ